MTSEYYRDHLLDQLYNFHQGDMFVQDYIAIFENLIRRSDVREHHSETITMFGVYALK